MEAVLPFPIPFQAWEKVLLLIWTQLWAEPTLPACGLATLSPQAQRGGARPLRVLEVCPALRAKAQGKHAISSSSRLRPASPSLISCSRSNLDHWRRQCRLHVGKAYATHKSKVLLTGPSGLMTQDVPTNTSACSLQWHLVWDSASPVQSFLLNCFLRCLSPSKRWRSPLNIYYSLHAA